MKDLKAGKLDARAKIGRFVGYDSESKGYRIYWPGKRSVTVERNIMFMKKTYTRLRTTPLFQEMYCLRGRGKRSSSTLKAMT